MSNKSKSERGAESESRARCRKSNNGIVKSEQDTSTRSEPNQVPTSFGNQTVIPNGVPADPKFNSSRDLRIGRLDAIALEASCAEAAYEEFLSESPMSPEREIHLKQMQRSSQEKESIESDLASGFLPQHSEGQLIGPQFFFMSHLFTVRNDRTPRADYIKLQINYNFGREIEYSGPELRQSDCLVFMALLYIARDVRSGIRVSFNASELCLALYGFYNGQARKRLTDAIRRLMHGVVTIGHKDTHLVQTFEHPSNGVWSISQDKEVMRLFADCNQIWIELEKWKALSEGLTTWLYTYVESQTKLIPTSLQILQNMCGSTSTEASFKKMLQRALKGLHKHSIICPGWSIKKNALHWMKPFSVKPTSPQTFHNKHSHPWKTQRRKVTEPGPEFGIPEVSYQPIASMAEVLLPPHTS